MTDYITSLCSRSEIASNGCDFVKPNFFKDYRQYNADRPSYQRVQEPTIDLNHFNPTVHRYHTAHLRGKHGTINYENETNNFHLKFWTLPKSSSNSADKPMVKQERPLHSPNSAHFDLHSGNQTILPAEQSIRISPIDPRNSATFKSSTPTNKENVINLSTKLLSPVKSTMTNEELYEVIHKSKKKLNIKENPGRAESPALITTNLSPVASEVSLSKISQRYPETGYLDAKNRVLQDKQYPIYPGGIITQKQETCADRHGPLQQTSRLDFKKLLLQHSVKLNTLTVLNKSNKLSAVEQLKLSKEKPQVPMTPPGNRSQINILDLSGSPKTYTHRKNIKPNNQPLSPGRTGGLLKDHKNTSKILLSPKSQWRFASPRSDVLSSPIPEANNEDDSNSFGEKRETSASPPKTVPIMTNQHFGARRSLIPINEHNLEEVSNPKPYLDPGVYPIDAEYINSQGLSRSEMIQARRAEFFKPPETTPKLSSFKSSGSSPGSSVRNKSSPDREKSPSTLETAL